MILDKEMYKKFGYNFNSAKSHDIVLHKCLNCKKVSECFKNNFKKRKTDLCFKCVRNQNGKIAYRKRMIFLNDTNRIEISHEMICSIFFSASLTRVRSKKFVGALQFSKGFQLRSMKGSMTKAFLLSVFEKLNIIDIENPNTAYLKKQCKLYLLSLSKKEKFNVLNYIFENHRRLDFNRNHNMISFSDKTGLTVELMKSIGQFELKEWKGGTAKIFVMNKGSLFINNQWVHIG